MLEAEGKSAAAVKPPIVAGTVPDCCRALKNTLKKTQVARTDLHRVRHGLVVLFRHAVFISRGRRRRGLAGRRGHCSGAAASEEAGLVTRGGGGAMKARAGTSCRGHPNGVHSVNPAARGGREVGVPGRRRGWLTKQQHGVIKVRYWLEEEGRLRI